MALLSSCKTKSLLPPTVSAIWRAFGPKLLSIEPSVEMRDLMADGYLTANSVAPRPSDLCQLSKQVAGNLITAPGRDAHRNYPDSLMRHGIAAPG